MAPAANRSPLSTVIICAMVLAGLLVALTDADAGDKLLMEAHTLERDGTGLQRVLPSAHVVPSRDLVHACAHQILTSDDILFYDIESGECSTLPGNQRPASLVMSKSVIADADLGELDTVNACLSAHLAAQIDGRTGLATCFRWFACDELTPEVSGPNQICSGDVVWLDAGAGYQEYYWEPGGETTQQISVSPWLAMEFVVQVTDEWACKGSDSHLVGVLANPDPAITGPIAMCSGETVTLDAGTGWAACEWSTAETTQTIQVSPAATTSYSVVVDDANGCQGTSPDHVLTVDEVWNVDLLDQTVSSDMTVRSCGVIRAGNNLQVASPAHLVLQAGERVELQDGFSVASGGRLTIRMKASLNDP